MLLENVIYDMSYIKYGVNIFLNMISHIFISSQLRSAWYLPVSQLVPSYPFTQLQLNEFTPSVQVPPFLHGSGEQSFLSETRNIDALGKCDIWYELYKIWCQHLSEYDISYFYIKSVTECMVLTRFTVSSFISISATASVCVWVTTVGTTITGSAILAWIWRAENPNI